MEIRQHQLAKTTPAVRRYIQESQKGVRALSSELGVCETTIRKWKKAGRIYDKSHTRHDLGITLSAEEEALIVYLRQHFWLSIDEIAQVLKSCWSNRFNYGLVYRCLKRHGLNLSLSRVSISQRASEV